MPRRALLVAALWLASLTVGQPAPAAAPTSASDYCAVRDVVTPYSRGDGYLYALLDRTYMLPSSFVPPDLVSVSAAGFSGYRTGELVRRVVVPDLAALRSAAAQAGHHLQAQSAYRSYATQKTTFDYWVSVSGYEQALRHSARPGHSEHQLGTTVDLTSGGTAPWNFADWAATPAGAWVAANAWRFGFVMSYPRGSEGVTCYGYEPWHYRWVGVDIAARVRSSGLTLRQFLACCFGFHAAWVDHSAYPIVPAGGTVALQVRVRNTGTETWRRGVYGQQVNLGIPSDSSAFAFLAAGWLSPNRVATTVEDVVSPGAIGTFRFSVRAPLASGTYRLPLRLVADGVSWLEDHGAFFLITSDPGFHAAYAAHSAYPALAPGEVSAPMTIAFRNTGARAWIRGDPASQANLGVKRDSTQWATSGLATGWLSANRVATTLEARVDPGQIGTFEFRVRAPAAPGIYRIDLQPVIDGVTWMEDYGVFMLVTVRD